MDVLSVNVFQWLKNIHDKNVNVRDQGSAVVVIIAHFKMIYVYYNCVVLSIQCFLRALQKILINLFICFVCMTNNRQ